MKKLQTRKILFIFLTLFYIFPLNACAVEHQEHSSNSSDLFSLVKELSELFLAGHLTVDDLEKKFSATAEQGENKKSWSVDSDKFKIRSSVRAKDKTSPVSVLTLATNELSQLELNDLEKLFGDSRLLVPSKSPWVKFADKKTHDGKNVSISAQLYSPPEAEVSPVLLLKLILE
ncbi:MAG: hypothetical protein PVF82_21215 [Gammaproteobacteria bacterium]|jgi:hypothetical protein